MNFFTAIKLKLFLKNGKHLSKPTCQSLSVFTHMITLTQKRKLCSSSIFHGVFKFHFATSSQMHCKPHKPLMILKFHVSLQAFYPRKAIKCVLEYKARLFTCSPAVEFRLITLTLTNSSYSHRRCCIVQLLSKFCALC